MKVHGKRLRSIVCVLVLFIIISTAVFQFPYSTASGSGGSDPSLIVSKTEMIQLEYSPTGSLLSSRIQVMISIVNYGSEESQITLIDRAEEIESNSLLSLYNTPTPSSVETHYGVTLIRWDSVKVAGRDRADYWYTAISNKEPPVIAEINYYINDSAVEVEVGEGRSTLLANISDVITTRLTLTNIQQEKYVDTGIYKPPTFAIATCQLSSEYFAEPETSPSDNYTTMIGESYQMTWLLTLDKEPISLNVSAKIISGGGWGIVELSPFTIEVSLDSEIIVSMLEQNIQFLQLSEEGLEGLIDTLTVLEDSFRDAASTFLVLADNISEGIDLLNVSRDILLLYAAMLNVTFVMLAEALGHLYALYYEGLALEVLPLIYINVWSHGNMNNSLWAAMDNITQAMTVIAMVIIGNNNTLVIDEGYYHMAIVTHYDEVNMTLTIAYPPLPPIIMSVSYEIPIPELSNTIVPGLLEYHEILGYFAGNFSLAADFIRDNVSVGMNLMADEISLMKDDMTSQLSSIQKQVTQLEEQKQVVMLRQPFLGYPEARASGTALEYNTFMNISRMSGDLILSSINLTNEIYGSTVKVHNLALRFLNQSKPVSRDLIEAEIWNGTGWIKPNVSLEELGLKYDSSAGALLLHPNVNVTVTDNIFVDWMGRPIRITIDSGSSVDVTVWVDCSALSNEMRTEPVETKSTTLVKQPSLVLWSSDWNITDDGEGEEREESLFDIILNPITLGLIVSIVVICVGFYLSFKRVSESEMRELKQTVSDLEKREEIWKRDLQERKLSVEQVFILRHLKDRLRAHTETSKSHSRRRNKWNKEK